MDIPNSSGFGSHTYYGTTKYDLGENSRGTNKAITPGPCVFFFSGHCRAGNRCSHSHNYQTLDGFYNYKHDNRTERTDCRVYIAPTGEGSRWSETVLGPDIAAASSSQYDPVTDGMDLILSITSEYNAGMALTSELPPTGDLVGAALHGTDPKDAELMTLNVKIHQSSEKEQVADCKEEKKNILRAEEIAERKDGTEVANNERDVKADNRKEITDGKSLLAFKFALTDFVKELLSPTWKERIFDKEVYKTIVMKVVNKVIYSVQSSIHIPRTQENINSYLAASKPNISKLVQAYITKEKEKAKANVA